MKTQKHKGVSLFFFFLKTTRCNPRGGKKQKKQTKKPQKKKKWHCQNGRTGRRSEATNRLIWSVTLHAEVHEEKGAPSEMPPLSIWMNAGKTEEAQGARGVFPARTRDPFESGTIQSEVPRLWKESLLHRPGLAGWYILFYSPHAHIHSSEMPSLYSQSSRPPEAEDASTSGGGSTTSYTAWKTLLQSLVSNWRCLQASSNRKITS